MKRKLSLGKSEDKGSKVCSEDQSSSNNVLIPVAISIPPPQQQVDPHKHLFDNSNIALEKAKKALLEAETVVGQLEEVVRDQASLLALKKLKVSLRGVEETAGHLDDSRTFLKQTRGILDLPDVAMKHLLSKLSFTDKCNLRLTCESLMLNVRNLDKRFRTWFIDLHQDSDAKAFELFEQIDAQIYLTLLVNFSDFGFDEIGKLLRRADKIVNAVCHKKIIYLKCDSKIAHFLNGQGSLQKLTTLETLKVVDDEEYMHDIQHFSKCFTQNHLTLTYLDFCNVDTNGLVVNMLLLNLKQLDLSESIICSDLFFPNLERITLHACHGDASGLLTHCAHNLEYFSSRENDLGLLKNLKTKFNKLIHLDVVQDEANISNKEALHKLISLSTDCLETLNITNQDMSGFEVWTKKFLKLKELHVSWPTNIGKLAINNLLQCSSTTLEQLGLEVSSSEQLGYLRCEFVKLAWVILGSGVGFKADCSGYPNLLRLCAPTLKKLWLFQSIDLDMCELDFKFQQLSKLNVDAGGMKEIQKCIETTNIEKLDLFDQDISNLKLDLFVNLRKLILNDCINYVPLVRACSSTLTVLIIQDSKVKLTELPFAEIDFPRLKLVEVDQDVEESEITEFKRNLPDRVIVRRKYRVTVDD